MRKSSHSSKDIKKFHPTPQQALGLWGERLAAFWLKNKGYKILDKHFTCREGEIDIIAKDIKQLVFIEVKTRTSQKYGSGEESFTRSKQEKFVKTLWHWLEGNKLQNADFRIDILALQIDKKMKKVKIRHFKNVVVEV
jgi:putative endonuclease